MKLFSSVNFFPCKVSRLGAPCPFTEPAQLVVWAHQLIQDIAAVLQPCQQNSSFLIRDSDVSARLDGRDARRSNAGPKAVRERDSCLLVHSLAHESAHGAQSHRAGNL